jgi:hypothetical protein
MAETAAEAGAVAAWAAGIVLVNSGRARAAVLTAWDCARERLRSMTERFPRPPVLSGWFLHAGWLVTTVSATASVLGAVSGLPAASVAAGVMTVLMAGWCALSVREVRAGWSDEELDAIRDRVSLEGLLDALPQTRHERRPA